MCCREYFDHEVEIEVTELEKAPAARLEKEDGLRTLNKYLVVNLKENNYPEIIFQNLSDKEKETCFEILDKMIHEVTYKQLDEKNVGLKYENDMLRIDMEQYQETSECCVR